MIALLPRRIRTIGGSSKVALRQAERQRMRISRFDVVTSLLMSLIVFIATLVFMLLVVWLTSRWSKTPSAIEAIAATPEGTSRPKGFDRDFEPPRMDEVEALIEPTLPDTIQAISSAVGTVAASPITVESPSARATNGNGVDDRRIEGSDHGNEVPRYLRWQLDFTARDLASYTKQLEFFGIELAAVGGTDQGIDLVNNLVEAPRSHRITDIESEKRLYFMWNGPSPLMQFDRQLLLQSGVPLANRQILKFIPKALENVTLANLELDYARSKGYQSVTDIAKTVFECKPYGEGYRFEVISQQYRRVSRPEAE